MSKLREQMNNAMIVRGYSPRTRKHYTHAVYQLAKYYHRSPDAISELEVEAFLLHLIKERGLCQSSVNAYVQGIRFFDNMLKGKLNRLPRGKEHRRIPVVLSKRQVQKLLDCTHNIKYKTIFMVAYGSGLRIGEIVKLKMTDIDSDRMVIHVRCGKGKKERQAMLSEGLLEALREYVLKCRPKDYLFNSRIHQSPHISTSQVSRAFGEGKKRAKIDKEGGIHSLRHTFATHLLESGVDLFRIKQLLGHAGIRSTVRYLHCTSKHLKEVVSPLDTLLKR